MSSGSQTLREDVRNFQGFSLLEPFILTSSFSFFVYAFFLFTFDLVSRACSCFILNFFKAIFCFFGSSQIETPGLSYTSFIC